MLCLISLFFHSKCICIAFKKLKISAVVSESSREWGEMSFSGTSFGAEKEPYRRYRC